MPQLLFIHGILGKPDYFGFLHKYVPESYRITEIVLEGHGGSPKDFARASMSKWRNQLTDTVQNLRKDGDRLVIVAHSMGTLFAIDSAVRGEADALFLLNPPLSLRITRRLLTTPLKIMRGKIDDRWTLAAKEAYSISDDPNLLHYIAWIPRYLELFREISRTRKIVGKLSVKTRVYLSAHDEMVSPRSAKLFPSKPDISVTSLPDSGHYCYDDADRSVIVSDFSDFLENF